MASVVIHFTAVESNDWSVYGTGSALTALTDSDFGTLLYNYPATLGSPCLVIGNSTASVPSDFPGSTITGVSLFAHTNVDSLQFGTFFYYVNRAGNVSTLAVGPSPFGAWDLTAARPGGGSWVHTDFFNSNLKWGFASNRNADNPSKQTNLFTLTLTVTYTPATAPVAEFTVSTTTGTSPLSVNFTDQSTNTPTSWSWSFGDGQTSTLQNPVNVYSTTATSTYTVTLTAANAGGTDSEQKTSLITVDPAATAVAAEFVASPLSGVQDLSVRFTDQSTGTPVPASWLWSFGDSATSTEQNPTHVYTTVGTYTVVLTVENTTPTTDTETKSSYITVLNGKPVPAFTVSTTTGTRPLTVEFSGSATNALPTSWQWDFGDGTGSIAQSPTHVYTTVGTFSPSLTVGNAIGTTSTTVMALVGTSDTYTQLTVGFATITASFTAAPLQGYIPFTVRFTDQSLGDANSWAWAFGDGETSSEKHPVHTYHTNAGAATLTITETGFSDDYDLRFGLTNYWKMEESTGTGDREDFISTLDLTPNASVTQTTGKNDFGCSLIATRTLTKATGFSNTSPWSYSVWIKFGSVTGTDNIFTAGTTVPDLLREATSWKLTTPGGLGGVTGPTGAIAVDTFYHVVWTYDGVSRFRLYVDGVLTLETTDSTTITGSNLQIGPPAGSFVIDELGRYGHEMDQEQVSGLYNSGTGEFFDIVQSTDSFDFSGEICPILPDATWGYFFEEVKYMMMEDVYTQNVCSGFDNFGGMAKAVELTQKRIKRFVIETAALRKEATLSAADADTEDFPLPSDLIELLRVEVDGVPYYAGDPHQQDFSNAAGLNVYFQKDALSITIPGTFGTTPTVKALYTYVPSAPSVPAPCTCPTPPATGPWAAFPLPYVLWWVIRYGLMADLFNQAGERNDPQRAGKCEELFLFGVQLYRTLYRGE